MPGPADPSLGNIQNALLLQITNSFAIVNANTGNQQTVTVKGLRIGDQISCISKTTFQAGLIIAGGDVSAADTLRVTWANCTGGNLTPTVGDTYTIEVNRPTNLALPSVLQ
jgi:hypothetical protein